nr:golgin candidate 6 isoform X12 [Arachis hypogaea]
MTNWNSLSVQLPISNNSKNYLIWLQEAILNIPRGITRLMDMLMDREDIQKIVIFEGAFEKILSIIRGEGNSDGGVVVQKQIVDIGKTLPLFMELQTLGDRM